eukprot:Filipodium_phascolosomae@DN452_c0_g1_i1.p1
MHDLDEYVQHQLLVAALGITCQLLEPAGVFVAKVFRAENVGILFSQFQRFFGQVYCAKPQASRNSSFEAFLVCMDFHQNSEGKVPDSDPSKIPFISCGSLAEEYLPLWDVSEDVEEDDSLFWDPDRNYDVTENEEENIDEDNDILRWYDDFELQVNSVFALQQQERERKGKHAPSKSYKALPPVQLPTTPAYAEAVKEKKEGRVNLKTY